MTTETPAEVTTSAEEESTLSLNSTQATFSQAELGKGDGRMEIKIPLWVLTDSNYFMKNSQNT